MARSETGTHRAGGFTTVEMLATLFLAGLLAALTTLSLAAPRHAAEFRDVADRIAYADEIVRESARANHRPGRLAFDLTGSRVQDAGVAPPRTICRLPAGWAIDRLIGGQDDQPLALAVVAVSPAGWSRSYALRLARGDDARWIAVNGMTGKLTACNDERDATEKVGQAGDDPD